jgi:glycosyltransferase involved in cell wall biosynthesis
MPHLLYIAVGFPPAAKSCAYRMLATANTFVEQGWDVTVITLHKDAWLREYGLDDSLVAQVHPSIKIVEVPLARKDLDPRVRTYSWFRARFPLSWSRWRKRLDHIQFPEPNFGSWRNTLTRVATAVHTARPVDLTVVSPAPYTTLAAAWSLNQRHNVPYIVDFRDAWSLDVISGEVAYSRHSRRGRWEKKIIADALQIWCVNTPIADHYRTRYPDRKADVRVLRNGYDDGFTLPIPQRAPGRATNLVFGYLGTVTFSISHLRDLLEGWDQARQENEVLAASRLNFRGHMGAGVAKAANAHAKLIKSHEENAVYYDGPVRRNEIPAVFSDWNVLVLILTGGRFVTSGKVYEYMATGLPIISAHSYDHAAADVLEGYPLWVRAKSLAPSDLKTAFLEAAEMAAMVTVEQRRQAQAFATKFARQTQLRPHIASLASLLTQEQV